MQPLLELAIWDYRLCMLWNFQIRPNMGLNPTIPANSKAGVLNILYIYQIFSLSPVQVELTPRSTRSIFQQLVNGLSLEFIAFCCQISLEDPTGTRLQERQVQTELLKVLLLDLLMSFPKSTPLS